jgi:3-methyladenine DNA glycosylase AlkD
MSSAKDVLLELLKYEDKAYAAHHAGFFRCFAGGYGDINDRFCGARAKDMRFVAKKFYRDTPLGEVEILLQDPLHEARTVALMVLVHKFDHSSHDDKKQITTVYLNNTRYINNWDLVDISVYKILGKFCHEAQDSSLLYQLCMSENLWEQRMSIVANWYLVRKNSFAPLLDISKKFLTHKHDLIHKAVGWILREMGKASDEGYKELINFLDEYSKIMPRTMLRYAIERLSAEQKTSYMRKG